MKWRIALILFAVILCGCHQTPASRPTDYPVPLIEATVLITVVDADGAPMQGVTVTAYVGNWAYKKTTRADGSEKFYLNYMATYDVSVAPPDGYRCDSSCEDECPANGGVVFTLVSQIEPSVTPKPTYVPSVTPEPTRTRTAVPTVPGPTVTPWDDLPAWAIGILSWDAQQEAGVDWDDAPKLWAYARENDYTPTGLLHESTINGILVRWVTCGQIVLAEAQGRVYEVPFWAATPTARPTITQTPKPTAIPTVPPVTPTPTDEPIEQGPPLPILYKMYDYGSDYQTTHPEYGPVGSGQWVDSRRSNPAPNVYNWDALEANLNKENGLKITLWDGKDASKPVIHYGIITYLSSPTEGHDFNVLQPDFWPAPYILTQGEHSAVIPPYDNAEWREYNYALMRAFGAKYNNDDRVGGVMIPTGMDGEAQPTKDWSANWKTVVMNEQRPGLEKAFGEYVLELMRVAKEAFPTKPLFIANAPRDMRLTSSELAAELGIGIKHAGMWTDSDSEMGYGTFWPGSWDMVREYSATVPIWLESPFGNGDEEQRYWAYLHGLHYHPDLITVHPEFLTVDPVITQWVSQHIGVTITDTPSVWTALRKEEFPKQDWGSGGVSGHVGDWQFWLYRDGDAPIVTDIDDTIYGRQARNITNPVRFYTVPGFEMRRIELTVKGQGQTIEIDDGQSIQDVPVPNDGKWTKIPIDVQACSEFYIGNAGLVHMVEAFREPSVEPQPEKQWTMMIYMAGDNNLAYYFGRTIGYLEMLMPLDNTNVIIMIDGPIEALAYYVEPQADGPYVDLVNSWDLGEVNTGDPATLKNFVSWATARYPSQYTYLAISDHGRGTHGIAYDDTSYKDMLTPTELSAALQGQHVDVLHADACLMGMLENGYQVKDVADYYVAYENLGWSVFAYEEYAKIADRGASPSALAVGIADAYHAHEKLKGDPRTSSAVDLSKIGPVIDRLNDLVAVLKVTDRETVLLGRKWAQRFDTLDYFYLTPADEYIDLWDFCLELSRHTEDESLQAACQALIEALDDYVMVSHAAGGMMYGPGYSAFVELKEARGVAIYFPQNSGALEFDEYVSDDLFTFTAASQWDDFLGEFYMAGESAGRSVTIEDREIPPMLIP